MQESHSYTASISDVLLPELHALYPKPITLLTYNNPFELLVKVMLSAQCSDAQVNKIAPRLFEAYPDARALSRARVADVARIIRPLGYFNTKSNYCIQIAQSVLAQGGVPDTLEALCAMPGVGKKSASVILYVVFKKPALIVDRHVARVASRLGLAPGDASIPKVETSMALCCKREDWGSISMLLNYHGRFVCKARTPLCQSCSLNTHCAFFNNTDS